MKKTISFISAVIISSALSAQLSVHSNGYVSVQSEEVPLSPLSVNTKGKNGYQISMKTEDNGMSIERDGATNVSNNWIHSINTSNLNTPIGCFNVGVKGYVYNSVSPNSGRAYGILGQAGNTTTGYNYGVYGVLSGNQNGAGVYGTAKELTYDYRITGRYAGYFNGDVYVKGNIYGTILTQSASSSIAIPQQVAKRGEVIGLNEMTSKLSQLNVVQYNLNPLSSAALSQRSELGDTISTISEFDVMDIQALEKTHYGFIAEELQQVYPDLVYENQQGELSINYIEMIPLLVQSIQELEAKIAILEGNKVGAQTRNTTNITEESLLIPALEQNNPNPFTENTVITYTLPYDVQAAVIYIYNMNGMQVDQLPLTDRGNASVTLKGEQLSAGMYIYSLVADGKVINTKRMILTK